ncbi:MAG TPA: hypothetical protein VEI04_01690 [Syntrophobacteria bacterium]|nr:hypothetical protein [Syntrophobacteria bacterium]
MRKIFLACLLGMAVTLTALSVLAQQTSMPPRLKDASIEYGPVTYELGQESGGQIPVSWKVDLTNNDPKDHTIDVQVRFYDGKKTELFHDSVMRNRVPANGTVTVSHTATVDAKQAQSVQSADTATRARR